MSRPLEASEKLVLLELQRGKPLGEIIESFPARLGGRGRAIYCANELAALGLYDRHRNALTPLGLRVELDITTTAAPPPTTTTQEPETDGDTTTTDVPNDV